MQDEEDEVNDGPLKRERLHEALPRRGVAMFGHAGCGLAFGGVFVAVGTLIILVGCKVIPVDPKGVHAPYWVLTAIGAVFAAAGLLVQGQSFIQHRRASLLRRMREREPDKPWLGDYPWHDKRFVPPRWSGVWSTMAGAVFLGIFAAPFNWVGFFSKKDGVFLPFAIGAVVMDLFVLLVLSGAAYNFFKVLKFGRTCVQWRQLPLIIGEPCQVQWVQPRVNIDPSGLTAKIRLIEEYFEVTGTGKNRHKHQRMDCLYEQTVELPAGVPRGTPYVLEFTIPESLPSTNLAADVAGEARPQYYLLTIDCDQAGIDFNAHYLLPLYHRQG